MRWTRAYKSMYIDTVKPTPAKSSSDAARLSTRACPLSPVMMLYSTVAISNPVNAHSKAMTVRLSMGNPDGGPHIPEVVDDHERQMIPPHNDSVWPDDTRRAAATLALAAATNSDMQFGDMVDAINDALDCGRPLQFVLELIRMLTAGLGEQFSNSDTAVAYQQLAAQCQAVEDGMRSRGVWRRGPGSLEGG
jgi:hypothetical protein